MESYRMPKLQTVEANNRQGRREKMRSDLQYKVYTDAGRFVDSSFSQIERGNEILNKNIAVFNKHITAMLYQGEPFVEQFLTAYRNYHENLMHATQLGKVVIRRGRYEIHNPEMFDLYVHRVGGMSLFDVEKMERNKETGHLSEEDIKKLDKMFSGRRTKDDGVVLQSLIFLATQPYARPDVSKTTGPSLSKLQENITDYLEYYTEQITDFSLSEWEEMSLMWRIHGKPWLAAALGCYIPARLGITSSSASKLYDEKVNVMLDSLGLNNALMRHQYSKVYSGFKEQSKEAWRKGAFPPQLEKFTMCDKALDKRASDLLLSHYGKNVLSEDQLIELSEATAKFIAKTAESIPAIQKKVIKRQDAGWRYQFPLNNEIIESVTVTAQKQNHDVVVYIVQFTDRKTHLTLEIDKFGNLYGFPPRLFRDNPATCDLLLQDILPPLLKQVEASKQVFLEKSKIVQLEETPKMVVRQKPERRKIIEKKELKARSVVTPLAPYLEARVADKHENTQDNIRVIYSRSGIKEKLGKKKVSDKLVNRIINSLKRFEQGDTYKSIRSERSGYRNVVRVGDLRIILREVRPNIFVTEIIKDRGKGVYDDYSDIKKS